MDDHVHVTGSMDHNHTSFRDCIRPPPIRGPINSTDINHVLFLAHCYILGTIFNLLAVSAAFFLYRLLQIKARPLVLSVNILLVIMAALRYIYLAVDPYNVRMYFPTWFMQIMEDIAIPCLTSAFAIIQFALFQLCKLQRPNRHMHSPRVILGIVVLHFTFVIVIDILLILEIVGCVLLLLCQVLTLAWGLILCVSVSVLALKLVRRDKRVKRTLRGDNPGHENGNQPNNMQVEDPAQKKKETDHLRKLKRISFSASVTGLICFVTALVGVILIVNPAIKYQIGQGGWLIYQTTQRLVEITFGFILLYISWQRSDGPST